MKWILWPVHKYQRWVTEREFHIAISANPLFLTTLIWNAFETVFPPIVTTILLFIIGFRLRQYDHVASVTGDAISIIALWFPLIRNLEAVVVVVEMFYRQGAAHLLDQSPKQHELIFPGVPNDLKEVAGRIPIAKLKRVERHAGHQQPGAKMEFVNFSAAIT